MTIQEIDYSHWYRIKSTEDISETGNKWIIVNRFVVAVFSDEPMKMLSKIIFTYKLIDKPVFSSVLSVFTPTCKSWSGELNANIVNYEYRPSDIHIFPYMVCRLIFETEDNCDVDIMFHVLGIERMSI